MKNNSPVQFFVYIVESPSPEDFYRGKGEGELITKAVSLNAIPVVLKTVVCKEIFEEALTIGIIEEMTKHSGRLPIIHLSAHGSNEGIQLTDRTILTWNELRDLFRPVNEAFKGNVLLCMSTCQGFSACKMAMEEGESQLPFWGVVGNDGEPRWAETAVAYATFYHQIASGEYLKLAVEAMKVASGNPKFSIITAKEVREAYLSVLKKHSVDEMQEKLEEEVEKKEPGKIDEIKGKYKE